MFHVILTLLLYGVNTSGVKCPQTCSCIETLISEIFSSTALGFDVANISNSISVQNLYSPKTTSNGVNVNESNYKNILENIKNGTYEYKSTKKCGQSTKNTTKDTFTSSQNVSAKQNGLFKVKDSGKVSSVQPSESNSDRSSKGLSTKKPTEKVNVTRKDLAGSNDKIKEAAVDIKGLRNARNKDIFTYQITCNGIRDLNALWLQYFPNPTTKLNIRQTFFQSLSALQQIIWEIPVKLNRLTVLSVSNSLINQNLDKKYFFKVELNDKEQKSGERTEEKRHLEFLPFASLQNPKLRSKSDLGFILKGKCKNMQVLNLVNNTITYLPQDTFHPFINLQVLNLSNNLIEFIDNKMFSPLVNLLQLDIHNNRIQSLNEIMFKNLSKLLFLDVSQNLVSNIAPSTFQYLVSLNVLNLASNPLSEKQEAMILLGTGKRLQVVDISKAGLKQIPGTLERSVRVLNLMGNHLLSIRCGDLDSYSLLFYLNLKGNKIIYVEDDALGRLEFLNNLQISENNLFQIPKSLPNNLEILNLSYNNIQNITNLDFLNLSSLKELSLSYNQVSNIERNAFNNLLHLKILDLSRNPILVLPNICGHLKLTVLNLSYFTNIPSNYGARYKQFPVQSPETIKHLNLESSPILTKIFLQDTKTLESFLNLEELDIRFTNLTTIRKDIFILLPKLKILKVEGNPWHCGKDILILSNWLKAHQSNETSKNEDEVNTAHCSTPFHFYKTTLLSLEETNFTNFETNRTVSEKSPEGTNFNTRSATTQMEKYTTVPQFKIASNFSLTGNNETFLTQNNLKAKKYKNIRNILPELNNSITGNSKKKSCCETSEDMLQDNQTASYLLLKGRNSSENYLNVRINKKNMESFPKWDNSSDFNIQLQSKQMSLKSLKKAEAVVAKDSLALKKEYNPHLSFVFFSFVGVIVVAVVTFTSVYFSRSRRPQTYQRQNQDIEVCSISGSRNELW